MSIHKKRDAMVGFYAAALDSLGVKCGTDGRLSLVVPSEHGDIVTECMSNDKRVTLPTDELLRTGNWEGLIAFHPLSENMLHGESEIIQFLRKIIQFKLTGVAGILMEELVVLAADKERHAEMTPTQSEFLKNVPKADEKMVKYFNTILNNHLDQIVSIYLKRNGELAGSSYRRVASVAFPMYHELTTEGTKVYKTNVGSKERKAELAALFEYVFPDPTSMDDWSFGSNADVAPYFHALLSVYVKIAKHLNKLIKRHASQLTDTTLAMKVDLKWAKDLDKLSEWRDAIPPLPGNKGASVSSQDVVSSTESRRAASAASVATQTTAQPSEDDTPPWMTAKEEATPTPMAEPAKKEGTITWQEMERQRYSQNVSVQSYPQAYQPAAPAPAMSYAQAQMGGYGGYGAPAGGYPAPVGMPAPAIPYGQPAGYGYSAPQPSNPHAYFHNSV